MKAEEYFGKNSITVLNRSWTSKKGYDLVYFQALFRSKFLNNIACFLIVKSKIDIT